MANNFFQMLTAILGEHERLLTQIANKLEQLEIGGGGGNATVADYLPNTTYKRNTLLVDPDTETMYRVIPDQYTSVSLAFDKEHGDLKLVGYESQFVTFNHQPTQAEIDTLPEDTLVAIYSRQDDPYSPALSSDNMQE
jgi:hypothetical protein